jgi:hypothetical protein
MYFPYPKSPDQLWDPAGLLFNGSLDFPGVKRSEREADHSPTFNAEVKNEWSSNSTPRISHLGVDKFTFTFQIDNPIHRFLLFMV